MIRKISHSLFAVALAIGMLAAVSSPSRAALSSADRTNAAAAPAPAPAAEAATYAAISAPTPAAAAPATAAAAPVAAAAAPVAAKTAPVASLQRKTIAPKATPRRFASAPRGGYPCH